MMKILTKYSYVYYHKKKYAIGEVDLKHNKYGFRRVFPDFICCIVDNKLNKRKKQLELHRLITGRGLREVTLK
jgi:hypothetical protein